MFRRGKILSDKSLLKLLLLTLSFMFTMSAWAQDSDDADDEDDASDLGTLIVTGSRIPTTDIEGPQPITVLTAADIEKQGFTNAFEALESLSQFNGTIQDDQFTGGFTQAASSLDLRGLGPGRTLILLNGRRATDYPLAFNGQSNVVNLGNIPSVMIERVEVLSSGASAIYGSDAVAGVVNFILKENLEGHSVNVRYGDTSQGGGQSERLQLSGGFDTDNFRMTYGFEYFDREPIYRLDRDFQDSLNDDPSLSGIPRIDDPVNGVVNQRTFLILDPFNGDGVGGSYIDPGAAACDPLSHLLRNSVEYSFRSNGTGFYCGSAEGVGEATIRNAKENYSFYTNFGYEFGNNTEFFGTVIYTDSETKVDTGNRFWQLDTGILGGGYFINTEGPDWFGIGGEVQLWQRIFTHDESGFGGDKDDVFEEEVYDVALGFRGTAFNNEFDWEASYSTSSYDLYRERLLISSTNANAFFLGDPVGGFDDFFGFGAIDTYTADPALLYTPLTHEQYRQISTIDRTTADSSNDSVQFVLSGELFDMPAGPVGFAGVAEWATQDYVINLDPQLTSGEIFGFTGTGGGGERDRYAFGTEFKFPLHDTLTFSAAARWDKYDDETRVDDAVTYNAGLEWRPTRNLLFRASQSTSFRAPDMHFVYAGPSGFFTSVTDRYLCLRDEGDLVGDLNGNFITDAGESWSFVDCTWSGSGIMGARQGSLTLEEEEGETFTAGFVWEIIDGLTFSADFYDIKLENVVSDLSIGGLVQDEAECRFGVTAGGMPVDINSQECQDVFARIERNPFIAGEQNILVSETLDNVTTGPVNRALRDTSGVDTSLRFTKATNRAGTFDAELAWNIVIDNESQQFVGDDILELRDNLQFFDNRSRARGVFAWSKSDFSTAVTFLRTGSLPNWAETGRCCTHITYNWSASYNVTDEARVSVFVQNVFDENPPRDVTYNRYPYYHEFSFNPYGREWFVQLDYAFGQNR